MSNARIVIGATGGQIEFSEGLAATGATGYGKLFVPSGTQNLTFVNSKNECRDLINSGQLEKIATDSLLNTSYGNGALFGASTASVSIGVCNNFCGGKTVSYAIGCCNRVAGSSSKVIGDCNLGGDQGVVIGHKACTNVWGVALGVIAKGQGDRGVGIGVFSNGGGAAGVAIGSDSNAGGVCTIAIGKTATAGAIRSIAIGQSSCASHTDATSIGFAITSERASTLHTKSILAYGQNVSKGYDVGSTGGNVSVDWDRSNTQRLLLNSNITDLRLDNPIAGAVYDLVLEQPTSTGRTVTWPASIKWAGASPPTLTSGATGAVDIVHLICDPVGGTSYYGSAETNFK